MKLVLQKMQNFQALGPQTPETAPHFEFLATRLCPSIEVIFFYFEKIYIIF